MATEDHPRGCGEHGVTQQAIRYWEGSSPRMRGALGMTPLPM